MRRYNLYYMPFIKHSLVLIEYDSDIRYSKKIHKVNLTKQLFDGRLRMCTIIT